MREELWRVLRGGMTATLAAVCLCGVALGEGCRLTVREDMYFLPATEMAGEESFPQVLILENPEISVWAVPNRGRLLFDLVRKETGHSQMVALPTPLPLRMHGLYTFDFGGVFPTFPWHRRDNQPLLLDVEETEEGDACVVVMRSQDPATDITLHAELRLPAMGSEAALSLRLANPRPVDATIDFGLVFAARPGGTASDEMRLVLPVSSVRLGESRAQWMGEEGAQVPWPQPWDTWGAFAGPGWFAAEVSDFEEPMLHVVNPDPDEYLRIRWEPYDPWTSWELFSWGPAYMEEMGAYDGFRVELQAKDLTVPGEGEEVLRVWIAAEDGPLPHGLSER